MGQQTKQRAVRRLEGAFLLLGLAGLAGASQVGAAGRPDLAVIVSPSNPATRIEARELASIFGGSMKRGKDGAAILPFNAAAGSPPRVEFDQVVLGLDPTQVLQYWVDKRIRGEGTAPRSVPDVGVLVRLVETMPAAIAYVPADRVSAKTRVVARIRDGRVVAP